MAENTVEVVLSAKVDELNAAMQQAVAGVDASIASMTSRIGDLGAAAKASAEDLRKMADVEALEKGNKALQSLKSSFMDIATASIQAAKEEGAYVKNLRAAGMEGDKLQSTVAMIRHLRDESGYAADTIAGVVQRMSALGPVTEETMKSVANIAAGAGLSLEAVGQMYARVVQGGEGASRAMMMFARQTGITTEQLRRAGAEVVDGKLFTGTPEAAEKARQALDNLANNRWPDAAKKAQGAGGELKAAIQSLQEDIGRAAAKSEGSFTRWEAAMVKAFHRDMSPEVLATIGVLGEMGGKMASTATQVVQFASNIALATAAFGPKIAAIWADVTATTAGATITGEFAGAEILAGEAAVVQAGATTGLTASIQAMTAAVAANPIGAVLIGVLLAASAATAYFTHEQNKANDAAEAALKTQAKNADGLRNNHGLLGMSTEQLRAHGATSKDVAGLIDGYTEAMRLATEQGNQPQAEKYRKLLEEMKALLPQLTEEERAHAAALQKTTDALSEAEHGYKMGTGTLQDVIDARKAHIKVLQEEYEAAKTAEGAAGGSHEETVKKQKELRQEQQAAHADEIKQVTENMALIEQRRQLGRASSADLVDGLQREIAELKSHGATKSEIMGVEIKLQGERMKQLETTMAAEKRAADASIKLHQDRAAAVLQADNVGNERRASLAEKAAQEEVVAAQAAQSAHRIVGAETVEDARRVADAQIAEAERARDAKIQVAKDEYEKVKQTEDSKVKVASDAAWRAAEELKKAQATTHDPEALKKYQEAAKKAADDYHLAWQQAYQTVQAAAKKSQNAQTDAEREASQKRIAIANAERDAKLAAIERVKAAVLNQNKEMAGQDATNAKNALSAEVAGAKNPARMKVLSDAYLAAKQKEADAARKIEMDAANKTANEMKAKGIDTTEFLANAKRIATNKWLNEQIEALKTVLDAFRSAGAAGVAQAGDIERRLQGLRAQLGGDSAAAGAMGAAYAGADEKADKAAVAASPASSGSSGTAGAPSTPAASTASPTSTSAPTSTAAPTAPAAPSAAAPAAPAPASSGTTGGGDRATSGGLPSLNATFAGEAMPTFGNFRLGPWGSNMPYPAPQSTDRFGLNYVPPPVNTAEWGFGTVNTNLSPGQQALQQRQIDDARRAMDLRNGNAEVQNAVLYRQQMQGTASGISRDHSLPGAGGVDQDFVQPGAGAAPTGTAGGTVEGPRAPGASPQKATDAMGAPGDNGAKGGITYNIQSTVHIGTDGKTPTQKVDSASKELVRALAQMLTHPNQGLLGTVSAG